MNLTEAKLKQMILDEIKSNLSPKETEELQQAIREVEVLGARYKELSEAIMDLEHAYQGAQSFEEATQIDKTIDETLEELHDVQREIKTYAIKYNVEFYDNPEMLIKRLKNKFRRKNL